MCKQALSSFNYIPQEMRAYLRNYGYSFSKRACEYAVSQMKRKNNATGKLENIEPYSKDKAEELLSKNGVTLENNVGYNFVYVMNMILADRWKSSTYSGAYPFTFRQPIKHKIAFKSTILYPFIP